MKTIIYNYEEIVNEEDLRQRVLAAAQRIRQEAPFQRVRDNYSRRMEACLQAEGGHFEHLM